MSRVLSAVAWPYANGPRHIGHVAGFGVPSDVFSRYMRMAGHDVLMVSGSDEHGTPILIAAAEAGVTAQELADQNHRLICEDLVNLGIFDEVHEAMALALRLAEGAPLAIQYTKQAVNKLVKDALNVAFDTATALEIVTFQSEDHREALAALREKRKPRFRGR